MFLIPGIIKDDHSDYVLYYIEELSNDFKEEIRKRLVAVCHGSDQANSHSKVYSYNETVKEFIKRYKSPKNASTDRKKGMIGELLVHVILEMEGTYITASPFFNMEEKSFKKGYDIALFKANTNSLWIAEVKSGEIQKSQKDASSAIVGLINSAKNDLKDRLCNSNTTLWLNALNAARVSMNSSNSQKDAVIKLLEQCADNVVDGTNTSNDFNVILSGALFHPMTEHIDALRVGRKYASIVNESLFKSVLLIAIQKETFEAVYRFLESEAK